LSASMFWYDTSYMLKNFILKKLIQSKMKNLPKEQQDMILALVSEHPELFQKIGDEIKAKTKNGMNEQMAMMQVMRQYQGELQQAIASKMKQ